jgi:hypothetical protein
VSHVVETEVLGDEELQAMQARLADLLPRLNERDRRLALATEAKSWGRGGISAVHRATGASRTTIRRGMTELADNPAERPRVGSGRREAVGRNLKSPIRNWWMYWMV